MTFLPADLIRRKRDGEALPAAALAAFVRGVTDGTIPDYQAAAMLMAIFFRGLDADELAAWTDAMLRSGDTIDLAGVGAPKVDKHSTGGVGDKISLALAPAVAACGVAVPMVSGRGLGHTGGTLDKLESIPGFRTQLTVDEFARIVGRVGACLIGQTERIAPADRKLYALRDVTGTVESIPLIASSIMSKKLAEGIDALVLDCKVGSGAFMKSPAQARALAGTIQGIGRAAGKRVTAAITDMNQPIGHAVGNAVEVEETIDILRGGGPADARALTVALGAEMLILGGGAVSPDEGARRIAAALDDGRALERFREIIEAQGGDPRVVDEPARLGRAPVEVVAVAGRAGQVTGVNAEAIGLAVVELGGGRRRKEDAVDPLVGILMDVRVGDRVEADRPVARVRCRDAASGRAAAATAAAALTVGPGPTILPPLVHEVMR
ncbi:MAG TPA: thymidine phosphorylase [Haliangiales bacterium]|nr:thymidine phosphorylase [Haliangiales bacterium]